MGKPLLKLFLFTLICLALNPSYAQRPIITSFSPVKAPPLAEVTITGSNFNPDTLVTRVYFGTLKAKIIQAGASQLKVLVPYGSGHSQLKVLNTSTGLYGISSRYFQPTFSPSPSIIVGSDFKTPGVSGLEVYSTHIADADGDGKPDMLRMAAAPSIGALTVVLNASTGGTYSPKSGYSKLGFSVVATLADLDGDGKPELLTVWNERHILLVQRNLGTPGNLSFGPAIEFILPFSMSHNRIECTDVDGDGKQDIALGTDNNIVFLRNTSSPGTISLQVVPAISLAAKNIRLADIDGDEKPDIIVPNTGLSVLLNTSTPGSISFGTKFHFTRPTISTPAYITEDIQIADMNDDGRNDVYTMNSPFSFSIFKNTTSGIDISFDRLDFAFPTGTSTVKNSTLADINGDGKPDLVHNFMEWGIGIVKILKNTSTNNQISFNEPATEFSIDPAQLGFTVNDINLDGIPDILSNAYYFEAYFYKPNLSALPKISSFSPTGVNTGDTVTISGTNFAGVTSVELGGKPATSFSIVSPTSIKAVVGSNTRSGYVTISSSTGSDSKAGLIFLSEPVISSFSPAVAPIGASVLIKGKKFTGTTSVLFGNVAASSFTVLTDSTITAVAGSGAYGLLKVTTPHGTAESGLFRAIPTPVITATGTTFAIGSNVILTANTGLGYAYRWYRNGAEIPGAVDPSYTVTESGTYKTSISYPPVITTSNEITTKATLVLPPNTFVIVTSSETCRNSNDGYVRISLPSQTRIYTAQLMGDNVNQTNSFSSTLNFTNLAAGKYTLCITYPADPDFKQCYEVVITEPKDLQLYSNVNTNDQTIDLQMSGSTDYFIELNGTIHQTSASTITLPLNRGQNTLKVYTSKPCQGTISRTINIGNQLVYPNPFEDVLHIPAGNEPAAEIEVSNPGGKVVHYSKEQSKGGVFSLDLSTLPQGIYVLKLSTKQSQTVYKIIKK